MNGFPHEFVTVDMRDLKANPVAHAQVRGVSVSSIVRTAVERELGRLPAVAEPGRNWPTVGSKVPPVKLSVRLAPCDAERLDAGAQRAGLSRGAFLAGPLAGVPVLSEGGTGRAACLAARTTSNAELATLSRAVHRLVSLLRGGQVQAAQEYRRLLDALDGDVRAHLDLAAGVFAELRPSTCASGFDDFASFYACGQS